MIHCFHDYIYIYITRIWLLWDLRVAIYYITLHVEHSLVPLYQQVYTVIVFLSNTSDRWLLKHKLNCAYDFPTYCNLYKTHSMRLKKHLLLHLRLWLGLFWSTTSPGKVESGKNHPLLSKIWSAWARVMNRGMHII